MIAVAGSSLMLATSLQTQRRTDDELRQHFQNVLTLRRTEALLVDAETGQRGYLLTSDGSFLTPYERARAELPGNLRDLHGAGIDVPEHRLETLGVAKLNELARTIELTRGGRKDQAVALVRAGEGKRLMDAIRAEDARLVALQQAQIESAIRRSEGFTTRTYVALALLIVSALALLWLGLTLMLRTQGLEAEAVRLREAEEAQRRTALVARELNHRVKNLFSIVLAIVQLASRGASSPKDAVNRIRDRIQALARAHEVSLGADPMSGFDFETMLRAILTPYSSSAAELSLKGPSLRLPAMRVTPIGLIIHELATNAIKYGAWSSEGGSVEVRWSVDSNEQHNGTPAAHMLRLQWTENREEPLQPEGATGFGSQLINAAVAQLDGSLTRERGNHGLNIFIDAPIVPAAQVIPS